MRNGSSTGRTSRHTCHRGATKTIVVALAVASDPGKDAKDDTAPRARAVKALMVGGNVLRVMSQLRGVAEMTVADVTPQRTTVVVHRAMRAPSSRRQGGDRRRLVTGGQIGPDDQSACNCVLRPTRAGVSIVLPLRAALHDVLPERCRASCSPLPCTAAPVMFVPGPWPGALEMVALTLTVLEVLDLSWPGFTLSISAFPFLLDLPSTR